MAAAVVVAEGDEVEEAAICQSSQAHTQHQGSDTREVRLAVAQEVMSRQLQASWRD